MRIERPSAGTPGASGGMIAAWAFLGFAVVLLFTNEEDPEVERSTGPRETVVAVKDLEERVAEKLGDREVPLSAPGRPLRIVASEVRWRNAAGERWLTVERVSASVRAGVLTGGAIVLEAVEVASPVLRLRQAPSGQWNLAGVFRPGDGDGGDDGAGGGAGGGVELREVRVRGGRVSISTPGRAYEATRVSAVVPVARFGGSSAASPFIRLASVDASVSGAIPGPPQSLSLRGATISGRPDGLEFGVGRLALDESVVTDVEGLLSSALPDPGLRARGRAPNIQFADIHRLLPEFPESGVASFEWSVNPLGAGRLAVQLKGMDVRSDDSHLAGTTTIIVGGETIELGEVDVILDPLELAFLEQFTGPLPYAGTVRGSVVGSGERLRFDVATALRAEGVDDPILARLQGSIALRGFEPTIQNVVATVDSLPLRTLRSIVPALPLRGIVSGTVSFAGMPGQGPLRIDATVRLPEGSIELDGTVRLGAVPSYDLTGSLVDVRLRELLEPSFPPVLLDARFTLAGTGTDPASADARLSLSGRFSGWQAGAADLVVVNATLRDGTLAIERAAARLATLDARVEGEWRLAEPSAGALRYTLNVGSLEPFGPYLPGPADQGAGSLAAEGTISGSLDRLAVTSDIRASDFQYGDYAARSFVGRLEYAAGDSLPRILLDAEAEGIVTATLGNYESGTAEIVLDAERFNAELHALRPGGGVVEVVADGRVGGPAGSDLVVRRALIDMNEERWTLTRPAAIELGGGGMRVDTLAMAQVEGPGLLLVSGRLLPLDSADFSYDLRALPVGEIQRLLGRDPVLTGRIWSEGRFEARGTPTFALEFRIADAVAAGVPILRLEGVTSFSGSSLHVVASGALTDTAGTIEADITFPLVVGVADSIDFGMNEAGRVEGRVRVDRFPLAVVAGFTNAVTQAVGSVSGTVRFGGTIEAPSLDGSLALNDVAFSVPSLDQRFESLTGGVEFAGRRAELVDVVARAGGTAALSGSIVFEELDDPVLDVVAELDRFEVMGAEDDDPAEVSGEVTMRGLLSAPVISGRTRIDNGTIDVPTGGTADPLEEVELASVQESTFGVQDLPGARPPAFGNVTIQGLIVDIEEDVWLATDQARARLSGELTVFHDSRGTRIFGNLEGNRGTFTLRAGGFVRRFEIREASIRFFGTDDLNPAIDITAARTMGALDDPLELVVRVTGTLERPSVALATGDGTPVPESELLSVLVFGQPSFTTATQSTSAAFGALLALGGLTDIASVRLQEALAEDAGLPIDYVQLRAVDPEGTTTTNVLQDLSIAIGTELYWDDVFLTVDFPPASPDEIAGAILWRIDREWALQLEWEPIVHRRAFSGVGFDEILGTEGPTRQFVVEIRRRWTY
ncbi:MAG TPA: translocation/assembly module TamB domain-containing protein [Longimicrobiales bacterium]|nr:translocation/assembly module TamB domain-containing protein [Longimicrobiales bacterium]